MPSGLNVAVGMQNDSISAFPDAIFIFNYSLSFFDGYFERRFCLGDDFDEFRDGRSTFPHGNRRRFAPLNIVLWL